MAEDAAEDAAEVDQTGERRKRALDDDQEIRNTVSSPTLKIHRRPDKNKEEDIRSRMEDKDYYDPGKSKIPIFNSGMSFSFSEKPNSYSNIPLQNLFSAEVLRKQVVMMTMATTSISTRVAEVVNPRKRTKTGCTSVCFLFLWFL